MEKKRKISLTLLTLLATSLLFLASCSMSLQQRFVKSIATTQKKEQVTATFNLGISNLELDQQLLSTNPMLSMITGQIKNTQLTGEFTTDKQKKITESRTTLSILGNKLPFETISTDKANYLSLGSINDVVAVMQMYLGLTGNNQNELTSYSQIITENGWENSYISLTNALNSAAKTDADTKLTAAEEKTLTKLRADFSKATMDYLNQVDKEVFTKKEELITLTLNKKEFQELFKTYQKLLKENKDYQKLLAKENSATNFPLSMDLINQLADSKTYESYQKLELAIGINQKNNNMTFSTTITPVDSSKTGIKTLQLNGKLTYRKFKGTPKVPNGNKIITEEQLNQALEEVEQQTNLEKGISESSSSSF